MESPVAEIAKEFGISEVWNQGIDLLGYPPTWADTPQELIRLRKQLKGLS